ncbi:hypothetical protein [Paenibacillus sp. 598K]|uniref:hypothetical protein n=1 Tax=Paenibacillus sp. 598K TaxID=1117987 RepID=UPI000FFE8C94|nr:hypothetical protein [Paenibacillus sp. 598K]
MVKYKFSLLVLTVLSLLTLGTVVQAQEKGVSKSSTIVVTPYFMYINMVGASLTISSSGKATPFGYVNYPGNYDSTIKIELQRQTGNGWTTVKSWSDNFSGAGTHGLEKEYYVASGNVYRVVATASIKSGSKVLETASSISSQVTY